MFEGRKGKTVVFAESLFGNWNNGGRRWENKQEAIMWPTAPTQWLAFEFAIEMPDAWVGDSEPKEQNQFSHRSMANLANVKVF